MLASDELLLKHLPEFFVFFQPKDVVSGDFYWAAELNDGQFVLVTADSTGHGVPGAIMSMLNISCLTEAVEAKQLTEPKDILNATRSRVIKHLANDGSVSGGKDGMDCSLVKFDFKNKVLSYSAANNPVWIVRNPGTGAPSELIELLSDKMPVGKHDKDHISFSQHQVPLKSGDLVYTLTDGLPDQFGGPKGKKFMYKKLKEILISISNLPLTEQKKVVEKEFVDWQGDLEQVDDVALIGIRV
jgi:serine phosphatase RsbU (regulator of sigma subunit)